MHPLADLISHFPPASPVVSPELRDGYFVRPQSGADLEAWESELSARRDAKADTIDTKGLRARLVQIAICDSSGAAIFGDCTIDQINAMPAAKLNALYDSAKKAWGLVADEGDEKN